MAGRRRATNTATRERVIGHNPLDGEQLLLDALYGAARELPANERQAPAPVQAPPPTQSPSVAVIKPAKPKPDHYRVVSISLYTEDIERLEKLVGELKQRGHTKANKSLLIRHALAQVDLDRVPKHR